MKSSVYSDVKAGKVIISNAKEFAEYANKRVNAITAIFVTKDNIIATATQLEDIAIGRVPGTKRVLYVERISTSWNSVTLRFFENTNFTKTKQPHERASLS